MGRRTISRGSILGPPALAVLIASSCFSVMPMNTIEAATSHSFKIAEESVQGRPSYSLPVLYVNGIPYLSLPDIQNKIALDYGIDVHWNDQNVYFAPEISTPSKPNFSVGTGNTGIYVNGKLLKKFDKLTYNELDSSAHVPYLPLNTLIQILSTLGVSAHWHASAQPSLGLSGVLAYIPVGKGTITYQTSDHGQWSMSFLPSQPIWKTIQPTSTWAEHLSGGTWVKEYISNSGSSSSYIFQNQKELVSYQNGVAVLLAQVPNTNGESWTSDNGSYQTTMSVINNDVSQKFSSTVVHANDLCSQGLALKYDDSHQTETNLLQPGFGVIASYGGGSIDSTPVYSPEAFHIQY